MCTQVLALGARSEVKCYHLWLTLSEMVNVEVKLPTSKLSGCKKELTFSFSQNNSVKDYHSREDYEIQQCLNQ
jgi:hypothetical protein